MTLIWKVDWTCHLRWLCTEYFWFRHIVLNWGQDPFVGTYYKRWMNMSYSITVTVSYCTKTFFLVLRYCTFVTIVRNSFWFSVSLTWTIRRLREFRIQHCHKFRCTNITSFETIFKAFPDMQQCLFRLNDEIYLRSSVKSFEI